MPRIAVGKITHIRRIKEPNTPRLCSLAISGPAIFSFVRNMNSILAFGNRNHAYRSPLFLGMQSAAS
jgi:hypothetical protein